MTDEVAMLFNTGFLVGGGWMPEELGSEAIFDWYDGAVLSLEGDGRESRATWLCGFSPDTGERWLIRWNVSPSSAEQLRASCGEDEAATWAIRCVCAAEDSLKEGSAMTIEYHVKGASHPPVPVATAAVRDVMSRCVAHTRSRRDSLGFLEFAMTRRAIQASRSLYATGACELDDER